MTKDKDSPTERLSEAQLKILALAMEKNSGHTLHNMDDVIFVVLSGAAAVLFIICAILACRL